MERILSTSFGFGTTISHLLPGLMVIVSFFMLLEISSPKNLTFELVTRPYYLLGIVAIAIIAGFTIGLFLDLFFHHRVLGLMVYGKSKFHKILDLFYRRNKYSKIYIMTLKENDKILRDKKGKRVTDYYYLPLVSVDVRSHFLDNSVHYEEFFSNMFFPMIVFSLLLPSYMLEFLLYLKICYQHTIIITSILTIISILATFFCLIVGGVLFIESQQRRIEIIKGAKEFKKRI